MAIDAIFLYGTLRHAPLLLAVLGRMPGPDDLIPGTLPDHTVHWAQGQSFPMIAAEPRQAAPGLILQNPTHEDIDRLNYFEGGFAYHLQQLTAFDASASPISVQVFFPNDAQMQRGDLWSLDAWVAAWGEMSVNAAAEAMEQFGVWTPQDLAERMPMIRRRADTMLAARNRGVAQDHHLGAEAVTLLGRRRTHSHFFALDENILQHTRYDGTVSDVLTRETFFAGRAVIVLPYDPVRDAVLVVEQFRANMFALGDPSPWVIEAVAGLIDPGETPEDAVRREAEEEAGVRPTAVELIAEAYSSTGSSTEFLHAYAALADFDDLGEGGGLDSEGEDIRRIILPFEDFADGLRTCRFRDAPLIMAGYWLVLNRDRLRGSA